MFSSNTYRHQYYETLISDDAVKQNIKLNENFLISSLVNHPVLFSLQTFTASPQEPLENVFYLVDALPQALDIFAENSNKLAFFSKNGWRFISVSEGMIFYVKSLNDFYCYKLGYFERLTNQSQSASGALIGDYKYSAIKENHDCFLLCNGQEVLRSKYVALFSLLSTSFGVGNGSTTFNLPDFRGRIFGGIGQGTGLTNRNIGTRTGSETHTLLVTEIPSHDHIDGFAGINTNSSFGVAQVANFGNINQQSGLSKNNHSKTSATGGGQPHNNMQPTLFAGNIFIYSGIL